MRPLFINSLEMTNCILPKQIDAIYIHQCSKTRTSHLVSWKETFVHYKAHLSRTTRIMNQLEWVGRAVRWQDRGASGMVCELMK